jgi:N-ethylmaleimide reductase
VGLRLSPFADYNNVRDPNPAETCGKLAQWLDLRSLAFLLIADTNTWAGSPDYDLLIPLIRANYRGPLIVIGGVAPEKAAEIIGHSDVDAVAFGRLFLANSDLPERMSKGGPYNLQRSVGVYCGGKAAISTIPF